MPYFWPERVEAFEPQCREIAANLVQSLRERDELEIISTLPNGSPYGVSVPFSVGRPRCATIRRLFAEDRVAMAEIARGFEGYVDQLLQVWRAAVAHASDDITSSLLRQQVGDRPLRDEEIVSVLRNWTVGEVGTISAGRDPGALHLGTPRSAAAAARAAAQCDQGSDRDQLGVRGARTNFVPVRPGVYLPAQIRNPQRTP